MKTQISLLVTSLAILPLSVFAQSPPPFLSGANYSPVEQLATDALPSPLETTTESAPCTPEPAIAFKADSNETSSDLQEQYTKAQRLIAKGAWRQAELVLKQGIKKFPDSRHLRMVYAELLWHLSERRRDDTLLAQSSKEAVRAMEIGLDLGIVDQGFVGFLSAVLSRTGDMENFERLFARALDLESSPEAHRRYARGLSQMDSPKSEDAFKAAVALQTEGSAHADYGEWLLDRGRYADVLALLPQEPGLYYNNFLRGVALEHLGRPGSARKVYEQFRDYSKVFPAPARFRIEGSTAQRGIRFDDESGQGLNSERGGSDDKDLPHVTAKTHLTRNDVIWGLSYMIHKEAVGENYGGKLAVGWVARARVLRGSLDTPTGYCPFPDRYQASSLEDAYKNAICQPGAFDGKCVAWCDNPTVSCYSYQWSQEAQDAAYDVFYGYKEDPVSTHCPGGRYQAGNPCVKEPRRTCIGDYWSYRFSSPLFQVAKTPTETCGVQQSCAPHIYGKVCADGGITDHCFSGNNACNAPGMIRTTATLSTTQAAVSTPYYVPSTFTHNAHLEAPEGSNYNVYLQHSYTNNGTDWADWYSNPQPGATEDIRVTSNFYGYFRWRVVAYQGSGQFNLCRSTN